MSAREFWIVRLITGVAGLGLQLVGLYAAYVTFGALDHPGALRRRWPRAASAAGCRPAGDVMVGWGLIVAIGLWLILADVKPVTKAKLMGNPLLIHLIVIGSGLAIHGGSADGAMAAIVSGCISAIYVRFQRRWNGYIRGGSGIPACLPSPRPEEPIMNTRNA